MQHVREAAGSDSSSPPAVENVEDEVGDGHFAHHLVADFLPAEALLQDARKATRVLARFIPELASSATISTIQDDFAVDGIFGNASTASGSSGNDAVMSSRVRE